MYLAFVAFACCFGDEITCLVCWSVLGVCRFGFFIFGTSLVACVLLFSRFLWGFVGFVLPMFGCLRSY